MDNEQTRPSIGTGPFYEGEGYLAEPDEDRRARAGQDAKHKLKT